MKSNRKKMTTSSLIHWSGLSAMVAGLSYVVVGLYHQPNILSSIITTQWAIIHAIATAMCFFFLLGVTGLYARQAEKSGWLSLTEHEPKVAVPVGVDLAWLGFALWSERKRN